MFKKLIGLVLVVMLTVSPAMAADVTYRWTAPTEGTPVFYYAVEVNVDGAGWIRLALEPMTPVITIDQETNKAYRVRVAGVDAEGHMGPFSEASDEYTYGAPGGCGKPGRD